MSRTGSKKGFTLVEVMVACAVLCFGLVMVIQSFFQVLNAFSYSADYLALAPFADEKLWEAEESLEASGGLEGVATAGSVQAASRQARWSVVIQPVDERLYAATVSLSWKSGSRQRELTRTAYAYYAQNTTQQ